MSALPNLRRPPEFAVRIFGEAKTKGSTVSFVPERKGKPIPRRPSGQILVVTKNDAGPEEAAWAKLIAETVKVAMQQAGVAMAPAHAPVAISATFYKRRPKSHFGTGRNADLLKPSAPAYPATLPDIDKLWRSALDAMTGVVWVDDGQVIGGPPWKMFIEPGALPRLDVRVWYLPTTVAEVAATRNEGLQQGQMALPVSI